MLSKDRIFIFAMFLSTLISHSNLYKFPAIVLLLLTIDIKKINLRRILYLSVALVVIIITGVKFQLYDISYVDSIKVNSFSSNFIVFFAIPIYIYLLVENIHQWIRLELLIKTFDVIIKVHLMAFFIQIITYILIGHYIDFVQPITGEASRYLNSYNLSSLGSIRFTGLYVEPSTYATFIVVISSISFILKLRARCNLSYFDFLAAISTLLTFSTASYVYGLGLLMLQVLYTMRRSRYKLLFVFIFINILFILYWIYSDLVNLILTDFIFKVDSRGGIRTYLIEYIFSNRTGFNYYLGESLYGLRSELFNLSNNVDGGIRIMGSVNDSGLLFYLIVLFGIIIIPFIIFYFILVFKKNYWLGMITFNLFLTKVSVEHYPLIIFFILSYFLFIKTKHNESGTYLYSIIK
ncbi:TPA: hypothetical protein ACX6QX_003634 [Photobacterium damselae]